MSLDAAAIDAVVEATREAVVVVDRRGRIQRWNAAAERLLGWAEDEVLGRTDPSVPADLVDKTEHMLRWLLRGGTTPGQVTTRIRRDGTPVTVTLHACVRLGPEDDPTGLVVLFDRARPGDTRLEQRNELSRDLVSAIRVDDVVAVLERAIRDLLDTRAGIVLEPDPDGRHLQGTRGLGIAHDEATQVELPLGDADRAWTAAARGITSWGTLTLGHGSDTEALFVPMGPHDSGVVLTLIDPRGGAADSGFPGVARAVADEAWTALQRAGLVAQLEAKIEQLEHLDQRKADWVAGLTHDLRSPLTGLVGFVKTLRRMGPTLEPQARQEYLDAMERQALRLVGMVEDLVLAARIEADGGMPITAEQVDLRELVGDVTSAYGPGTRDRLETSGEDDTTVLGDPSQLARVVRNLLDNGLKYGPDDGRVELRLERRVDAVQLHVRDDGAGVAEREQEQIFERFGRGVAGETAGSTGLGLFISRAIARRHAGDVGTCDLHDGSCFVLRLPAVAGDS